MRVVKLVIKTAIALTLLCLYFGCSTMSALQAGKAVKIPCGKSYLSGYFIGFPYVLILKDLHTNAIIKLNFKKTDSLQLAPLPAGDYALLSISGKNNRYIYSVSYCLEIPEPLMLVIKARKDTITHLGSFTASARKKTSEYNNNYVEAKIDFNSNFKNSSMLSFLSVFDLNSGS
jgi:hypothetical protein